MTDIDWSKAPEGATHWMQESSEWLKGFWKCVGAANYFYEKGEWVFSGGKPFGHPKLIARPSPAWSGEGLPPAGVVCEAFYMGQPQGVVSVRYSGQCMILWSEDRKSEQCGQADDYLFKPIRTSEQIAADEREAAVAEMLGLFGGTDSRDTYLMQRLYDAGYRKQEPKP